MTTIKYVAEYLETKENSWTPKTYQDYKQVLIRFAAFVGDTWPVRYTDIVKFLNSGTSNPISQRTYFGHIHAFFKHLELIAVFDPNENPAAMVKRLRLLKKPNRRKIDAFSHDEIDKLFAYLDNRAKRGDLVAIRDAALFRLMYSTGCRSGEVAKLQMTDLDIENRSAIFRDTKTHEDRMAFFNETTQSYLASYLSRLNNIDYTGDVVFPSLGTDGLKPINPNSL